MDQKRIGRYIKEAREKKNLTITELSKILKVSSHTVSSWERGLLMPEYSKLKLLCNALNITINDLISGEKVTSTNYHQKLALNVRNTINYTNKKLIKKNNIIGIIMILFGLILSILTIVIYQSKNNLSSIFFLISILLSLIGLDRLIEKLPSYKIFIISISCFVTFTFSLFLTDYLCIKTLNHPPHFTIKKIDNNKITYYDTPIFDVIKCSSKTKYIIIKNTKYKEQNINSYCN